MVLYGKRFAIWVLCFKRNHCSKRLSFVKKTIPFEVTDYSEKQAPVKVVNQPKIPPRIEIPYTGNAIMILVVLLGFAIIYTRCLSGT